MAIRDNLKSIVDVQAGNPNDDGKLEMVVTKCFCH